MSKGEIVRHVGEGKYVVRQQLAVDRIQTEIASLNERIASLAIELPTAQTELLQAEDAVKDKVRDINLLIPSYQAGAEGAKSEIAALQRELVKLQSEARLAGVKVAQLTAENLAALKRRNLLESVPEYHDVEAWCADYTEDLTGDVGLVDINDEGGQGVVIHPGFNGQSEYNPDRDGAMFPPLAQTPIQLYFNSAILPGVQKWMPRYRVATIKKIEGDLCDIQLDEAESSAQGLNINETDSYSDVPIQYMECNGAAFAEGDRVIVRMFDSGPQVIGFETNPKPCAVGEFAFIPAQYSSGSRITYGEPYIDGGGLDINPPLGTQGGTNPAWSLDSEGAQYTITKGINPAVFGNRNWLGPEGKVVSWDGPPGRVYDYLYESESSAWRQRWKQSSRVYYKLQVLADLSNEAVDGYTLVCGAALTISAGTEYLVVVCGQTRGPGESFRLYRWPTNGTAITGPAELMHTWTSPASSVAITDWYFNRDGFQAVCTFRSIYAAAGDPQDYDQIYKASLNTSSGFDFSLMFDRQSIDATTTTTWDYRKRYLARQLVNGECQIDPANETWWEREIGEQSTTIDIYQPIYVEMIGASEKTVFLYRPGFTRSLRITEFLGYGIPGVKPASNNTSRTDSLVYNGATRIELDDGTVVAELPFTEGEQESFYSENNGQSSFAATYSRTDVTGGLRRTGQPIMTLDARFRTAVMVWGKGLVDVTGSTEDGYQFKGVSNELLEFTAASGSTSEVAELGMWVNGSLVHTELLDDSAGDLSNVSTVPAEGYYRVNEDTTLEPEGCGGLAEENIGPTSLTSIAPATIEPGISGALEAFGFAGIGNKYGYFVLFNDSVRDPYKTGQVLYQMQGLTGYQSVERDLFGQNDGDRFFMDGITVV